MGKLESMPAFGEKYLYCKLDGQLSGELKAVVLDDVLRIELPWSFTPLLQPDPEGIADVFRAAPCSSSPLTGGARSCSFLQNQIYSYL